MFKLLIKHPLVSYYKYGNFLAPRHPVTILVTAFTNPYNLTNDLLILKTFDNKQIMK